jgi:transcriptional regulator with XRE-family HTH domain
MSKFGDRLRDRRLAARLRQTDFRGGGVTQSQLSRIESGDIEPSVAKIDSIAAVLNLVPIELVADTELEGAYFAARLTSDEIVVVVESARLTRAQRLIAVEESYGRIRALCEALWPARADRPVSIDDEAYYQHAARIFRRSLDIAREYDTLLGGRMFVPDSLIGESTVTMAQLRVHFQRSVAYLRSLILEYPEANDEAQRREICRQLGLDRLDFYVRERATEATADEAV